MTKVQEQQSVAEQYSYVGLDEIEDNFLQLREIKNDDYEEAFLVKEKNKKKLFIYRHIRALNLPYRKLRTIVNEAIPQVIYYKEHPEVQVTTVVEEYVEGTTFSNWLRDRDFEPISDVSAKRIFYQLASAMEVLSNNGIIHRSICPENIILVKGKDVKLVGFNHAIFFDAARRADDYHGVLGFAPPEQEKTGYSDYNTDIYSLGASLHYVLGTDYRGKYKRVLRHMLAINPEERYGNGRVFRKDLQRANVFPWIKVLLLLFAAYLLIMIPLFFINFYYNPTNNFWEKKNFEREQQKTYDFIQSLKNQEMPKLNTGGAGNGTVYANNGKLHLKLTMPGLDTDFNSEALFVNLGNYDKLQKATSFGKNAVYVPANCDLVLTIDNNTGQNIKNPVYKFIPTNMNLQNVADPPNAITTHEGGTIKTQRDIIINKGEKLQFKLSLAKAIILQPFNGATPSIQVVVESENYPTTSTMVYFKI